MNETPMSTSYNRDRGSWTFFYHRKNCHTLCSLVRKNVQVIVDFEVVIQEPWTDELNDSTTNEFKELARIYIKAFQKSFSQVDTSEVGSSTISFAEVRVVSFILNNFSSSNVSSLR